MTEQPTIGVDEVQAAIDLELAGLKSELATLKAAIEMIVIQVGSMGNHMNENFTHQGDALRETQQKHNELALWFTSFVESIKQLDCLRED